MQVNRRQFQRMSTKQIMNSLPFELTANGEVIALVSNGEGNPYVNVSEEAIPMSTYVNVPVPGTRKTKGMRHGEESKALNVNIAEPDSANLTKPHNLNVNVVRPYSKADQAGKHGKAQ